MHDAFRSMCLNRFADEHSLSFPFSTSIFPRKKFDSPFPLLVTVPISNEAKCLYKATELFILKLLHNLAGAAIKSSDRDNVQNGNMATVSIQLRL